MAVVLVVLFLVIPVAELFVIVQVAGYAGVASTIALLVLVSVLGAWLVKREGVGVLRRLQDQLTRAELPTDSLVDGGLILFAGALMLTPGFLTDLVALLLLLPPTRAVVRRVLLRRFRRRLEAGFAVGGTGPTFMAWAPAGGPTADAGAPRRVRVGDAVIVADSHEASGPVTGRPELGGRP